MVLLPSGDFEQHSQRVLHTLQLIRLGSQVLEETCSIPQATANSHTVTSHGQTLVGNGSHPRMHPVFIRQKRTTEDGSYMCRTVEDSRDSLLSSSLPASPYPLASDESRLLSTSSSFSASDCFARHGGERYENRSNMHGMPRNKSRCGGRFQVQVEVYDDDASSGDPASSTVSLDMDYFTTSQDTAETFRTDTESTIEAGSKDLERTLTTTEVQTSSYSSRPLLSMQPERLKLKTSGSKDTTSTEGDRWRENKRETEMPAAEGRERLEQEGETHLPLTSKTQGLLSEDYVQKLEHNFIKNHLLGESTQSVMQSAEDIIRQIQVSLKQSLPPPSLLIPFPTPGTSAASSLPEQYSQSGRSVQ